MILHILEGLPKEYDALITVASNDLDNSTNPMTLDRLRKMIRSHYQRLQKSKEHNKKEEALVTYQPFKGRCRNCGKFGHKAVDCRSKNNNNANNNNRNQNQYSRNANNKNNNTMNNNNNNRPNVQCYHCGK